MKKKSPWQRICSFLEMKRILFNQYLLITDRIKGALKHREEDEFEVLISKRQEYIRRIDAIDRSMNRIVPQAPKSLSEIPTKWKGLIESHIGQIKTAMETVALSDRELLVLMKEEGTNVRTELFKIQKVRQAAEGYRGERWRSPRFINTVR